MVLAFVGDCPDDAYKWESKMMAPKRLLATLALVFTQLTTPVAAPAQASVYKSFTTFSWSGKPCVTVESPVIGNTTVCSRDGFFQINETIVQAGQWIGVRIPLDGQTHVECAAWLGPAGGLQSMYAHDSADSSLGAGEADCLRHVP